MNLIQQLEKEQVAKLSAGKEIPDFQPGDTVLVNVKVVEGDRARIQAYEGVCIGRAGAGLNENFTVRKISYGEGVERVFPLYSPMIASIKVVRRGKGRRRRRRHSRGLRPARRSYFFSGSGALSIQRWPNGSVSIAKRAFQNVSSGARSLFAPAATACLYVLSTSAGASSASATATDDLPPCAGAAEAPSCSGNSSDRNRLPPLTA